MASENARKLIVAAEAARYEIIRGQYPHRFSEFSIRYRENMLAAGQIDYIYAGHQASVHLNTPMGKLTDQKYMLMRIMAGVVVEISVVAAAAICRTVNQNSTVMDRQRVDEAMSLLINQVVVLQGGRVEIDRKPISLLPEAETRNAIRKIMQCRNNLG